MKASSIPVYLSRLKRYEDLESYCPECFKKTIIHESKSGEHVCSNCGYVLEEKSRFVNSLPWNTSYALSSHIAEGKSLGFTMPESHLFKILARVNEENGLNGAPLPIRQVKTVSYTVDPPLVKRILRYGSRLLKNLGLATDKTSNHILADQYGRLLRKIAAYIIIAKSQDYLKPHLAARAALYYLLSKTDLNKAKTLKARYPFSEKYSDFIFMLQHKEGYKRKIMELERLRKEYKHERWIRVEYEKRLIRVEKLLGEFLELRKEINIYKLNP